MSLLRIVEGNEFLEPVALMPDEVKNQIREVLKTHNALVVEKLIEKGIKVSFESVGDENTFSDREFLRTDITFNLTDEYIFNHNSNDVASFLTAAIGTDIRTIRAIRDEVSATEIIFDHLQLYIVENDKGNIECLRRYYKVK